MEVAGKPATACTIRKGKGKDILLTTSFRFLVLYKKLLASFFGRVRGAVIFLRCQTQWEFGVSEKTYTFLIIFICV